MTNPFDFLARFPRDRRLSREQALSLVELTDQTALIAAAARRRDAAHGDALSYSRKVFIPLTQLCRDVCHYCTFARPPRKGERAYLLPEQALAIAEAGRTAGCKEALFTLGDKPELRYGVARAELRELGHETTLSYLAEIAGLVLKETGLLPHVNPGLMSDDDLASLRSVSVSQGIMLESLSLNLCAKGGPHHGSPDKHPEARLDTIRRAGEQAVPFTSGILIGIGETRAERIEALLALRDLNDAYGHIQEVIIQNFRPKPGTRMAGVEAPPLDDHLWTIAVARLLFEPEMNIQAPPNLSPGELAALIGAGINDWGGVSPVTPDHVNPEAPWPHLRALAAAASEAGKTLTERLAIYPAYRAPSSEMAGRGPAQAGLRSRGRRGLAACRRLAPGRESPPPAARSCASSWPGAPARLRPRPLRSRQSGARRAAGGIGHRRAVSGRGVRTSPRFAGRPTTCVATSTATSSATWSPATSTTPTSAPSNASSAPFQKASSARICAAALTTSN